METQVRDNLLHMTDIQSAIDDVAATKAVIEAPTR
jgi:hypothetical protein